MTQALMVLPVTLAVLLVSMCVPVACVASPAGPVKDPTDCGHSREVVSARFAVNLTTHSIPQPAEPVHQHGDPLQCKHSVGSVQAVTVAQQANVAGTVAVPAVVAPVIPAAAPLGTLVAERPARPPGLVLTVSQLRI